MRQFNPALIFLLFFFPANTVPAQCLDYDSVLPVIGEAPCPNPLIAVAVSQSHCFAIEATNPTSRQLAVYSISDPEQPEQASTMDLPLRMGIMHCSDGRLYLGSQYNESSLLLILDVSSPLNPCELGRMSFAGNIQDIEVRGSLCAVAAQTQGLVLIDVADPEFMTVISTFAPYADAFSVDLRDDKALVGFNTYSGGFVYWLDLVFPTYPQVISSLQPGGDFYDATLIGEQPLALVTHGWNYISTIDLTVPSQPIFIQGPRITGAKMTLAEGMVLCQGAYGGDATLVDISDPFNLRWLAYLGQYTEDSALLGSHLILARASGLAVVELTDPEEMPIVGVLPYVDSISRIFPTGNPDIVLGSHYDEFELVDFSDPTLPVVRFAVPCDYPQSSASKDSLVFVLHQSGTLLLDIKDPSNPLVEANLNLPGTEEFLLLDGNLMYLGSGLDGLYILDGADPTQPAELGYLNTPGFVGGLAMHNQFLILGDGYSGLKVVDVSDSSAPQIVGQVTGGMNAQFVIVEGARCFTAGETYTNIVEVDLSQPANPVTTASITLPSRPWGMLLKDDHLWVNTNTGVWIYNIDTPGQPWLEWSIPLPGHTNGLLPVRDLMATLSTHLFAMRPPCVPAPLVNVTAPEVRPGLSAAPNPFNAQVEIRLRLTEPGESRLTVYDLHGRQVRVLWQGWLESGPHQFGWDGRNEWGRMMASGIYLTRFQSGQRMETGKVVLAK